VPPKDEAEDDPIERLLNTLTASKLSKLPPRTWGITHLPRRRRGRPKKEPFGSTDRLLFALDRQQELRAEGKTYQQQEGEIATKLAMDPRTVRKQFARWHEHVEEWRRTRPAWLDNEPRLNLNANAYCEGYEGHEDTDEPVINLNLAKK
jgi:hypothetical protein